MKIVFRTWVIRCTTLLFILMLLGPVTLGQVTKEGQDVYRHLVKAKETFYSISKLYNVSIDELKRANPGVSYPKAGDYLVVPGIIADQEKQAKPYKKYTTNGDLSIYILARILGHSTDSLAIWNPGIENFISAGSEILVISSGDRPVYIIHGVKDERSSLKDIALLYGVSYSTIKEMNPQIKNRVWQGQKVKIPVLEENEPEQGLVEAVGLAALTEMEEEEKGSKEECKKDLRNRDRTYRVVLMVPFSLEEVAGIDTLLSGTPSEAMDLAPFRFIQFYQGFLQAADTLVSNGGNMEILVFDVDHSLTKANRAVRDMKMRDADLIVGPFYKNTFSVVADFARDHNIPVINPLSVREDILMDNPNVFKILPSKVFQVNSLSSLVERKFRNHHVFIVKENAYQGAALVDSIHNALSSLLHRDITVVNYQNDSIPGVRTQLSRVSPNLVILFAESEVMPVELLPMLYEEQKELQITIAGLPEWEKFEHLENQYLINLGAYLFSGYFIDYSEPEVKQFITSFRSRYHAEPLEYAFNGYDIGLFFLSALMDYGRDFPDCIRQANYPLLHTRFLFRKVPGGGYDNTYWNVYHFQEYQLIPVPGLQ